MKLTMSYPIVAVLVLALAGMVGCSDNPVSPTGRSEPAGEHGGNEGGEGSESHAGSEGGGGEGSETSGHAEGPEGGGGGDPSSPILALDESWDGFVNGVRVAMSYDPDRRSFSGIVENTTAQTLCSVQIELNLKQGTRTVVELGPSPVGDLAAGASATTELLVDDEPQAAGVTFDAWEIHPEVFDCNGPGPNPPGGEGNEISGHAEGPEGGGGGESGGEHGSGAGGGEGGESHAGREGGEGGG